MYEQAIFQTLKERIAEPRKAIQVLLGPRQVGKTTMALALAAKETTHYASADLATLRDLAWLEGQWEIGRQLVEVHGEALLVLDEAQKISQWSEMVKKLWDEDTRFGRELRVILLGSFPWLMQKRLGESLVGRFEALPVTHCHLQIWKLVLAGRSINISTLEVIQELRPMPTPMM